MNPPENGPTAVWWGRAFVRVSAAQDLASFRAQTVTTSVSVCSAIR